MNNKQKKRHAGLLRRIGKPKNSRKCPLCGMLEKHFVENPSTGNGFWVCPNLYDAKTNRRKELTSAPIPEGGYVAWMMQVLAYVRST